MIDDCRTREKRWNFHLTCLLCIFQRVPAIQLRVKMVEHVLWLDLIHTRAIAPMNLKDLPVRKVSQIVEMALLFERFVSNKIKTYWMPNACSTGRPCPPGKKTDDAQGRCCVFPFTYLGKSYDSCTTVNHNKPWCSFDTVYRGQWANCGKKTRLKIPFQAQERCRSRFFN